MYAKCGIAHKGARFLAIVKIIKNVYCPILIMHDIYIRYSLSFLYTAITAEYVTLFKEHLIFTFVDKDLQKQNRGIQFYWRMN